MVAPRAQPRLHSDSAMHEMDKRMQNEHGWPSELNEIRRFLDTWYFSISDSGHLHVRPLRDRVACRDMHAFLERLEVLRNDGLPVTMTFDFTRMLMSAGRWRRTSALFRRYAEGIASSTLVVPGRRQRGGIIFVLRSNVQRPQLVRN